MKLLFTVRKSQVTYTVISLSAGKYITLGNPVPETFIDFFYIEETTKGIKVTAKKDLLLMVTGTNGKRGRCKKIHFCRKDRIREHVGKVYCPQTSVHQKSLRKALHRSEVPIIRILSGFTGLVLIYKDETAVQNDGLSGWIILEEMTKQYLNNMKTSTAVF